MTGYSLSSLVGYSKKQCGIYAIEIQADWLDTGVLHCEEATGCVRYGE